MEQSDWADFFSREESFFNFVTSQCVEIGSFGDNAYPKYSPEFTTSGKMIDKKPQHVRYICHANGDQNLYDEIKRRASSCYSLYNSLSLSDKPCSRQPIFLENADHIGVHIDKAHSSQLITHRPLLSLVRERKHENYDIQMRELNDQVEKIKLLGIPSAQIDVAVTTLAIKVDSRDLVQYFGRSDVVYRRPSGLHYRSRVFWGREAKAMKLGFFISRDPIQYHEVTSPRLSRTDSYENSGQRLSFGAPCDGTFWVAKNVEVQDHR